MTKQDLLKFYQKRKIEFEIALEHARKRINLVSNARLIVAILFLVLLYFGLSDHVLLYALLPLLIIFTLLVQRHGVLFREKTHTENLMRINRTEEEAQRDQFDGLDTGSIFTDIHHPYAHDLDLFGDGSVFQYVNRCSTHSGKQRLANLLKGPLLAEKEINDHQEAFRELAGNTAFRQHIQAAGMEIDEQAGDREQLKEWIRHPSFLYPKKGYAIFLIAFPIITLGAIVASFFFSRAGGVAVLCAIFQWIFLAFHLRKVNAFHQYISRKKTVLAKFAHMLHYMQGQTFNASLLKEMSAKADEAGNRVQSLASLVNALDARLNSMTNVVVNSLLLYDLQCVYRLEKWKEENAANLMQWLDAISAAELYSSIGTFSFNHPSFCWPEIQPSFSLTAKDLGHPLLDPSACVTNDLLADREQSVLIITGANMAGKSTFLRAVGVNVVLALAGAPVCATEFKCPVIHLRTGMRTADSLKDNQSYFYAELNRLKSIMDELRGGKPVLILLDEILKGTNSTDKQAGSIALVKQLLPHHCLALIATHDIVLGELEGIYPTRIRNFCFEANIENDQLSFDYKLKKGIAVKMNATFLMKKMGIIPA